MKLIDKDALVAEIERRRDLHYKYYMKNGAGSIAECKYDEDREILSFLDTLEVKEVDEEPASKDLEEAADKHLVEKGYLLTTKNGEHLAEVEAKGLFKAGAKWQKTKACEWLKENKEHPLIGCEDPCLSGYLTDGFIEDFKQAMEE